MRRLKIRAIRRLFARHRLWVFAEAFFFWFLAVAACYWMVGYFIVPSLAADKIEQLCGGAVTIHSGRLKGFSGIHLNGVVLASDADRLQTAPALRADSIDIHLNVWQLLRGRFSVGSVELSDFLVTVDYDPVQKHWSLGDFSPASESISGQSDIPFIRLDRGALRMRTSMEQGYKTVTTMGVNGTIAKRTGKNEYGFLLKTDGRFGYGPSQLEGTLQLGSKGQPNQFRLNGAIQTPRSGVLQNHWDLRDIDLKCSFNDQAVTIERCEFSLGDGHGSITGRLDLQNPSEFTLDVDFHQIELAEYPKENAVVYIQLQDYLDAGLKVFLNRYHPSGMANVEINVQGMLQKPADANLYGRIICTDISICDDNFPYQINHLKGDIKFNGRSLELAGLTARHGDVNLRIDGSVTEFGPEAIIDMRTTSRNLQLDTDLYRAIADPDQDPGGTEAKMWHEISPGGVTELDYRFHKKPETKGRYNITLRLLDVSAMYKDFRYPLQHLTGTVVLDDEKIQLNEIVSTYRDGSAITLNGELTNYKGPDRDYHITCRGRRIPVDETLTGAFPPEQRSFFDHAEIEAVTDFEIEFFPNATDPSQSDYFGRLDLDGQRLQLHDFPLPITHLDVSATIARDLIRINRLDGQTESGHIHLNESKLWPQGADPNQPGYSLMLDVSDFQLNDAFWQAAGTKTEQLLGKLRLSGAVDANGLLESNTGPEHHGQTNLKIDCQDNPVRWDTVPMGQADGTLTVKGTDVIFQDFSLNELPLDTFPRELMNEKAGTIYDALIPRGTMGLCIRKGFVRIGEQGPLWIDADVSVQAQSLLIGQADPPHQLDGTCDGHFVVDVPSGQWQAAAHYDIADFHFQHWQISDIVGGLVHDPNTHLLQSSEFKGRCYDGEINGGFEINLGEQPDYKLELNYNNINLAELPSVGDTHIQLPAATAGRADGRIVLTGLLDAISKPRGKFTAIAKDLEMGRQSLLGKILTAVQLKQPEEFVFHGIDLNAEIVMPELIFDRIRIIGSPLVFDGTGTVNLQTRQVSIELSAWDRIVSDRETIFDMLARGIGSALWKVQIYGDIKDPKVDAVYLSILKQPLDIFKDNEE